MIEHIKDYGLDSYLTIISNEKHNSVLLKM